MKGIMYYSRENIDFKLTVAGFGNNNGIKKIKKDFFNLWLIVYR